MHASGFYVAAMAALLPPQHDPLHLFFFEKSAGALPFIKKRKTYKLRLQSHRPEKEQTNGTSNRGFRWEGFSTELYYPHL
jgi:hypothetical protein